MKTLTVRLPESLFDQIDAELRSRKVSKSDVVRERLASAKAKHATSFDDIAHLVGSVKGLPADLSTNKKKYLRAGYGRKPYR